MKFSISIPLFTSVFIALLLLIAAPVMASILVDSRGHVQVTTGQVLSSSDSNDNNDSEDDNSGSSRDESDNDDEKTETRNKDGTETEVRDDGKVRTEVRLPDG